MVLLYEWSFVILLPSTLLAAVLHISKTFGVCMFVQDPLISCSELSWAGMLSGCAEAPFTMCIWCY